MEGQEVQGAHPYCAGVRPLPESRSAAAGQRVLANFDRSHRMGIIPPNVHRILDFLLVILFALAPTLFHITGNTRMLAYALAVIHLLMTLATQFPGSARRPIPFHVHGIIDFVVGLLLIAIPLVRHWTFDARKFYLGMGIAIVVIAALTRFRDTAVPVAPRPVV
jgi:hypothetical protein